MKKLITSILAVIMLVALVVPTVAVYADEPEVQVVDATGYAENNTQFTVAKKYFAVSYTTTYAEAAGAATDNGCIGITLGGGDGWACVFMPYDGVNEDSKGANMTLNFGPWWATPALGAANTTTDISASVGKEVTILVLGEVTDKNLTVTVYFNGEQVNGWAGAATATATEFNGQVGWATKLTGVAATVKYTESDTALDKTVFDAKVDAPVTEDAPKTGDATAIAVAIAALTLVSGAAVVVCSKKRDEE